jgi:hypothetical protein
LHPAPEIYGNHTVAKAKEYIIIKRKGKIEI